MMGKTNCDRCVHYGYDEEYECYTCDVNLDEDEMQQFLRNRFVQCPIFGLVMSIPL